MAELQQQKQTLSVMEKLLEILKIMNRELVSEKPLEVKHSRSGYAVHAVEEFIQLNYTRELSLEKIAGAPGYNKTYLCETFKQKKGIGIFEYLKEVRLRQAMKELRETKKTVTQIALECGFSSSRVFSRTFLQKLNMSAGNDRKKWQSGC